MGIERYVIVDWKVLDILNSWEKNKNAFGKCLHHNLRKTSSASYGSWLPATHSDHTHQFNNWKRRLPLLWLNQSLWLPSIDRKVVIIPLQNRRFSCTLVDNTVFCFCHENVGKRYGHSGKHGFWGTARSPRMITRTTVHKAHWSNVILWRPTK